MASSAHSSQGWVGWPERAVAICALVVLAGCGFSAARGARGPGEPIAILLERPDKPFVLGKPMILRGALRNQSGKSLEVCPVQPENPRYEMHAVAGTGVVKTVNGKRVAYPTTLSMYWESFTWTRVARLSGKPLKQPPAEPPAFVEPPPVSELTPPPLPELPFELGPGGSKPFEFDLMKTPEGAEVINSRGRFSVSLDYSFDFTATPSPGAVEKPEHRGVSAESNKIIVTVLGR